MITAADRAAGLLAGPRGRRVCLCTALAGPGWPWAARHLTPDPWGALQDAADRTTRAGRSAIGHSVLWAALVETVDAGRCWEEPDEVDALLAGPRSVQLLRPVAELLADHPATAWWWTDLDQTTQTAVGWPAGDGTLPAHLPAGDPVLARTWSTATVAEETRAVRERPGDPAAMWSGCWWSAPCPSGLPHTARTRPRSPDGTGAVPVGLWLVEDEGGWPTGRTWPAVVRSAPRVLEVRSADDWVALVARHPLEVTAARRHDWFRCTGRTGDWLVPDWGSLAAEVDAVHVTVGAWLAAAGRAVDVPGTDAATVLAGWDPDTTWWLTDVLESGDPTDWVRTDEDPPDRWLPA